MILYIVLHKLLIKPRSFHR